MRHTRRMFVGLPLVAVLAWPAAAAGAPGLPREGYDEQLCITAQRILLNAPDIRVRAQSGTGNGFHTIQMSVDEKSREVVIATTSGTVTTPGGALTTHVACKMVDRDRVNDTLGLSLPGPARSCRDVNEHTYAVALASLSETERSRYLAAGRQMTFGEDAVIGTGGEWLPLAVDDYIRRAADGQSIGIAAPTVRVPWDQRERGFFQGTQHCKLVTLAAMQRWMRVGAFDANAVALFPRAESACTPSASAAAGAGSCLFYFAPVDGMFCQDYSGTGWTAQSARQECRNRHASREAQRQAKNRYEGAGGVYNGLSCAERTDAPVPSGTCIFHCDAADETRWNVTGPVDATVSRACDVYLPATPR